MESRNQKLENLKNNLFLIPYEIKEGVKYIRGTNNLVSEGIKIICIDTRLNNHHKMIFPSILECSRVLNLNRAKIKNSLLTGEIYQNYKFIFSLES